MKKFSFIILVAILSFGLIACTNQKSNVDTLQKANSTVNKNVRERVWEQLDSSQKELIKGSWSDAKVRKITLKSYMGRIEDKLFIGKEVYEIDFQLKRTSVPNNMIVFADMKNGKIIGYAALD